MNHLLTADTMIETIIRTILVAVRVTTGEDVNPGRIAQVEEMAIEATGHIQGLITDTLSNTFDPEMVAKEWNEAIEFAIQTVEGS